MIEVVILKWNLSSINCSFYHFTLRNKMGKEKLTVTIWWKLYWLHRITDPTAEDIHHTIWVSLRHDWYDVQNPINKQQINRRYHEKLNLFFGPNQAPHLQLKQCLELWEPVLSDRVRDELYSLLSLNKAEFYKDELVRNKHKNKKL